MDEATAAPGDPIEFVARHAPWLQQPELGCCLVGSHALAFACRQKGLAPPRPRDVDLAWALDVAAGEQLLRRHDAFLPTTGGNVERGTLAMKVAGQRLEITAFRGSEPGAPLRARIERDLQARDMTVAALAVELASGTLHDPTGGLNDWQQRCIRPVGDVRERVREHPVRWLRYYRKAREWAFELHSSVRKLDLEPAVLDALPKEAITGELRAALLQCASPGRFFVDLHEAGLLSHLLPELDLQFDGRPAGPQQWHPELGQALHMVLALEWAAAHSSDRGERDRLAVLVAVLGHDLGKGYTDAAEWPAHRGHEGGGLEPLDRMLLRLPGLADQRGRTLARTVCELHLVVQQMRTLRPGTMARLYDEHFRAADFPVDLFALAVAADAGGRLGLEATGHEVRAQVERDLHWLRAACERVDAGALRARHADIAAFKLALHEARARAIADAPLPA